MVELFGQPFRASVAAAELARASGCALIGVTIVRKRDGYAGEVLPEFEYDRRALGNREARRELTQQILRAFEPEIREHLDQWYHFVPIWPADAQRGALKLAAAPRPLTAGRRLPARRERAGGTGARAARPVDLRPDQSPYLDG